MFKPSAKVLAYSVTDNEQEELLTLELTFHRYVLAQFNKHRAFSSNAASSRAIPTTKLIKLVSEANVQPPLWEKNQPGMQAGAAVSSESASYANKLWEKAKRNAIDIAVEFAELGIHKQAANRVLEPFLPITVVATGITSAWENFFAQRRHPDAAPEMRELAEAAFEAIEMSLPKVLVVGEWHLPYYNQANDIDYPLADVVRACVGRCARVSYLSHSGTPDVDADVALFTKLASARPPHLSPFEHLAVVTSQKQSRNGNFSGSRWLQLRHNHPYLNTLVFPTLPPL